MPEQSQYDWANPAVTEALSTIRSTAAHRRASGVARTCGNAAVAGVGDANRSLVVEDRYRYQFRTELATRVTPSRRTPTGTDVVSATTEYRADRNAAANPGERGLDPDPARLIEAYLATNVSVDRPRDDRDSCSVTLRLRTRRRR